MSRRRSLVRAAVALLCVTALVALPGGPGDEPADAALPLVPGNPDTVEPGIPEAIQPKATVDNRTVDSAIGIGKDGNAYVWGRTGFGMNGVPTRSDPIGVAHRQTEWPVKVAGLPEGAIVALASGIYNFNALDAAGYVWGWGGYSATRDGTGTNRQGASDQSVPPARLRVGTAWNGSGPLLSGITAITGTEMAGAGIAADGTVYHWGLPAYGGPPSSVRGAARLGGLPDPSEPGNFPVYIKGGYRTFWLILESGDIWYWGGPNPYERPRAVGGGNGDYSGSNVTTARRSTVLNDWNRANSPSAHIVAIDSGINLGGALLSTGQVLTWGTSASRVGGRLPNSSSAATNRLARAPGVLPNMSNVVHLAYTFTGAAMVTADGRLYGYGDDSYECFPRWPDTTIFCGGGVRYPTVPAEIDTNVVDFSVGQGYVRWKKWVPDADAPDGYRFEAWGQGYNPRGAIGHDTGTVRTKRPIEFRHNGSRGEPCTEPRCDLTEVLR